jgi:Sec-independent protein secretion pathway component TatC
MWLLFEIGIYVSRLLVRAREKRNQESSGGLALSGGKDEKRE